GPQTFTMIVHVNASAAAGSTITNRADVSSTTADSNTGNNSSTATTTVATSADVSVTKTDSPDPVTAGQNLTYTIIVTNNGPSDAQGVSLTDTIPANTTFVSFVKPAGWTFTNVAGLITANDSAALAAGATATFTLVVNVDSTTAAGTTISNTATVATTTTETNTANNTATA